MIVLWMCGGPSQLDTFDLKPGTRSAGFFVPIATDVDGIRICEHLPRLARRCRHLALVRSLTSPTADHARAELLGHTGHLPSEVIEHPWLLGSAAAELVPASSLLPGSVMIGKPIAGSGYLGDPAAPWVIHDPDVASRALRLPPGFPDARKTARRRLLERMDARFAAQCDEGRVASMRSTWRRAAALSDSDAATAFDLAAEPTEARAAYGDSSFGRGCLLARRLVEHGVRFVEVRMDGWDTHLDNFDFHRERMGVLDPAFAALLDDLEQRGLLAETLVLWMGEFGRTPEMNRNLGRDHHWRCFTAVLAGGGVRGGQVIGASDATGHEVADRPVTIPDLHASVYTALGLDPRRVFTLPSGRPVQRLDEGEVVRDLFV